MYETVHFNLSNETSLFEENLIPMQQNMNVFFLEEKSAWKDSPNLTKK